VHRSRFCEDCYERYKDKHKLKDVRERILVAGHGVRKELLEHGDEIHHAELFDRIGILYEMRVLGKPAIVDSTTMRGGRPVWFESGCSGPCIHVQILGANRLYQASTLDVITEYFARFQLICASLGARPLLRRILGGNSRRYNASY